MQKLNGSSLQMISRWDLANKIPIHGQVSFSELAQQCDICEPDMRRILRYAMVHHRLFCEPRTGFVAHTIASRKLKDEPLLRDGLWLLSDMAFQSYPRTIDALERFKDREPNHSAASLALDTDKSMYDAMEGQPAMAARFGGAMASFATFTSHSSTAPHPTIIDMYPWNSLDDGGLVVDVGGSRGADCVVLAQTYPNLKFVVQDQTKMIESAESGIPPTLAGRVAFMPYSFFTPQTCMADAYLFKQCFHNWPDHYCVEILKNQIPALKQGAHIIIVDSLVPGPGEMSLLSEKTVRYEIYPHLMPLSLYFLINFQRAFDMLMLTNHNGREREAGDWINIFKQADPRFHVTRMRLLSAPADFGPSQGIIELAWEG